ncbi:MAG: RagB/SusD family nutrient uptake outer membrane protein [Bacteroidaceae bacterium]|nr:RagB/SusD family nutrient uptake outer membrane protein [Bacteroidaceae bacterium]
MKRHNKLFKFASLVAAVSLITTSCDDWLTVYPQTQIVEENFWEDKNDLEGVRYAAYKNMADQVEKMIIWGDLRSDLYEQPILKTSNQGNYDNFKNIIYANIDTTWAYYDWSGMYSTIAYCNKVLQHGEEVLEKDKQFTAAEWTQMKAEMVTMRALSYFYLVRAFKFVPFTTKIVNSDKDIEYFPQIPALDVLDFLIKDVESVAGQARNRFVRDAETKGMITNSAIYALLSDMYLWRASILQGRGMESEAIEGYKQCIYYSEMAVTKLNEQFEEKKNNAGPAFSSSEYISWSNDSIYTGKSIQFMYRNETSRAHFGEVTMTAYNNIYRYGNSDESIFELQFNSSDGRKNGAVNSMWGASSGTHLVTTLTPKHEDIRYWFSSWNQLVTDRSGENYCLKYASTSPTFDRATIGTANPTIEMTVNNNEYNNWIVYRLSDVLLNNAEARACLMGLKQDVETNKKVCRRILRMLNRRWYVDLQNGKEVERDLDKDMNYDMDNSGNGADQYFNHVMNTRKIEFVGEGKRWFDLVRLAERKSNSDDAEDGMVYMFNNYMTNIEAYTTIRNRCDNLWGLYCPIYYMECKAYRANGSYLQQNPVWNKSKYER